MNERRKKIERLFEQIEGSQKNKAVLALMDDKSLDLALILFGAANLSLPEDSPHA